MTQFHFPRVGVLPKSQALFGLAAAWGLWITGVPVHAAAADEPPAARKARVPEFLEMFWMIVTKGADMGPTDGWFHPSTSRYDWSWLASRDGDRNGGIDPTELGGSEAIFRALDRDGDGMIRADDLDWSPESTYLGRQAQNRRRFSMLDRNSNGRISPEEWTHAFERAAEGKGSLSMDDLGRLLDPPMPATPPPSSGPSKATLLAGLFKGELGSRFEGPDVGDPAPDFRLKTHDGKAEIALSDYRGEKPVVLIFGSFT